MTGVLTKKGHLDTGVNTGRRTLKVPQELEVRPGPFLIAQKEPSRVTLTPDFQPLEPRERFSLSWFGAFCSNGPEMQLLGSPG